MQKIKFYLLILASLIFLPQLVRAEVINNFAAEITINVDSSLVVQETIDYDFGLAQKHGIYRNIPFKYQARGGNYTLDIRVLSVKDLTGKKWDYTVDKSGNNFQIKIGDADTLVSGLKTYIIQYQVTGAINYFQDHDELFWNITGNDWTVPIKYSGAKIYLNSQQDVAPDNFKKACYFGSLGSVDQTGCTLVSLNNKTLTYTAKELGAGQGWSVVIGWPKGLTEEPTAFEKFLKTAKDNLIILLPILVFIALYIYWKKNGQDPKGRGTIVPEYEPPKEMLPAEGGVIYDEKMDTKDLTATIIDLARRGYLKIKETEKKVLGINAGKEWSLIKEEKNNNLIGYEADFLEIIFDARSVVTLGQLKADREVGIKIKKMNDKIYEQMRVKGWFVKSPQKVRATFIGFGWAILVLAYILSELILDTGFGPLTIASLAVAAMLFIIFSRWMPKKTPEGVLMKEKLEGFKMFLSVTEKDRVQFHFSPSSQPEKFAEYLPWAIIFGVEKEWANVFKGIDLPKPDWFDGYWTGFYTANVLSDSLNSFNKSFGTAVAGATAAKGGSGFGGGGFSGGGFGGGGGGSW